MYNYRARSYSPILQRFLTEDPLGLAGGDANLYQYVNSGPTCATDRLGAYVTTEGGSEGLAIAGRKDGALLTKPDIRQFDAAVRECERRIGRSLTPEERRQLHDEITGLGLGFREIVEICVAMFGSRSSILLLLEPPYGIPYPTPVPEPEPVPVPVPVPPHWEWVLSA